MSVKSSQLSSGTIKSICSPASGDDRDLRNDFGLVQLKMQQIKVLQQEKKKDPDRRKKLAGKEDRRAWKLLISRQLTTLVRH